LDKRMDLYPRYIATAIKAALADTPVVCLLGPRQAGKTTLARQLEPERAYFSFDDHKLLEAAQLDPIGFLQLLPERVILDEVQRVPELLPAIKAAVDRHRDPGRFLLTGSANLLLLPTVSESLAGRIEVIRLYPLTELEKQRGEYRLLEALLANAIQPAIAEQQPDIAGLATAICQGGYPEPITRTPARARKWFRQYLQAIIQRDVKDIAAIRDEDELYRLVELLADRTANLLNVSNLAQTLGMRRETVEKYLSILERLFLVRRLPAWHRNTSKRLVKTPKIHVVDSGLAATLNRLDSGDWLEQGTEFGALVESFVVQQLLCQASWIDHDLQFFHYRDKDKVEVDLVIEQGRNVWGVEVKRAATIRAKDTNGLARLKAQSGHHFRGGMVLYTGAHCLSLPVENCFAVPMDRLWV
jgi:predicted AAA+ superfamily ATPase